MKQLNSQQERKFKILLDKMLEDEDMAQKEYTELKKLARKKGDKETIELIKKQEAKHYKKLKKIKRRL